MGTSVTNDSVPDSDILQAEMPVPAAISVRQDGPVRVQELPAVAGISRHLTVGNTNADTQVLVGADPSRRRLVLIATGSAVKIGATRGDVSTAGAAAEWPAGVVLTLLHCGPLWIRAVTAPATVDVMTEQWVPTDGS